MHGRLPGAIILMLCTAARAGAQVPPKPAFEIGFEERVRSESWDDIIDHSRAAADARTQIRFRSRLWASYRPSDRLGFVAGLNNENRTITRPDMSVHGREVIVETLYLDARPGRHWTMRAGRQNLMRGEGFILFDGTPLDGSRTAYFNALVATREFGKGKLELLAISNPRSDQYLPRFAEAASPAERQRLVEWDERAVGAYFTFSERSGAKVESYVLYKTETGDVRPVQHPQFQPDRSLGVAGGRAVLAGGRGLSLTGEGAVQLGRQDAAPGGNGSSRPIRAWGGYVRVGKELQGNARPAISLAYIGLSGDDPGTRAIEGWDPVFSRWPRWSELYIYSLVPENGVAYWTNTGMWEAEVRLTPAKPLSLRATYYHMTAFRSWSGRGAPFGTGTTRGDLYQLRADLTVNASWKGHVLYEHFVPGSFYSGRDDGYFLRFEVIYTFKHAR